MPPSQTPVVRPQLDVLSDLNDKAATAALPLAPNQAPQHPSDSHAPPASTEKLPADLANPDTTTVNPPTEFACGTWRPHYSPSLKFLFAIIVMIVWPWVFYGVVKDRGGIEMNRRISDIMRKHPQDVDYFVTAVASGIAFLIGYLFQTSVIKLAQKWVVFEETDIFRLSFFSALKNRSFVWSWGGFAFHPQIGDKIELGSHCDPVYRLFYSGHAWPYSSPAPTNTHSLGRSHRYRDRLCIEHS